MKSLMVLVVVLNSLLAAIGQLFLKSGMNSVAKSGDLSLAAFLVQVFTTPQVFLGAMIYGFSLLIWLFVLSKVDLSFAYGLVAITLVFVLIFSKFFLNENLTFMRILGSAVIIFGIFLVSRS